MSKVKMEPDLFSTKQYGLVEVWHIDFAYCTYLFFLSRNIANEVHFFQDIPKLLACKKKKKIRQSELIY